MTLSNTIILLFKRIPWLDVTACPMNINVSKFNINVSTCFLSIFVLSCCSPITARRSHFEEHWCTPMLLKLSCGSESPRSCANSGGPHLKRLDSAGLGLGQEEKLYLQQAPGAQRCCRPADRPWVALAEITQERNLSVHMSSEKELGGNSPKHSWKLGLPQVLYFLLWGFLYVPDF